MTVIITIPIFEVTKLCLEFFNDDDKFLLGGVYCYHFIITVIIDSDVSFNKFYV